MPLKILHALRSVDPASGGPIEGVRQLTTVNRSLGHEVEIVTLDRPDAKFLQTLPVPVHAMGPALGSYGYSWKYVKWLRENARKYDCVIINGIWGFNCFGTWLALRKENVPYFAFTHGMLDPWFKRTFPLKHFKKWLYWPWACYPVLRDAHGVFFTCEEERRLARESFWLYDCREFVLSYGTAGCPPQFRGSSAKFLAQHPDLKDKETILFLGRVHPKKGPDLLIHAVNRLIEEKIWDRSKHRVVFAGPAEGEYASSLKATISALGISDQFYWTGMLLGEQKWGSLESARTFILPSHQENFGLAVAEALSMGVPVLLGKGVNIWPEIVEDGAGFAERDNVDGCVALLSRWFALTAAQRQRMGVAAKRCYDVRFTADRAANSFVAALYLLIGTREQ